MMGPVREQRRMAVARETWVREAGKNRAVTEIRAISEPELLTSDHNCAIFTVSDEDTVPE
jgi:hypothetical protein